MANVKWLFGHIRNMKFMYAWAIVIFWVSAALQLSTVGVQQRIIDDVFVGGEHGLLPALVAFFAVCFVGSTLLEIYGPHVYVKNRSRLERSFTFELLGYLYERIPIRLLQSERTAKYTGMLTNDVMLLANLAAREVPLALQAIFRAVLLVGAIAWANPALLVMLLALAALYVVAARQVTPAVKRASRETVEERTQLQVLLDEQISGTREIVSYALGEAEDDRYRRLFGRYFAKAEREGMLVNRQTLLGESIRWGATALILGFCGYSVLQGAMSLGTFAIVFQFSFTLLQTIQGMYGTYLLFSQQIVYADRLRGVMAEAVEPGRIGLAEPVRSIRFEDVEFRYAEHADPIFDGLRLDIAGGRKTAFVGESGSGKSTLLQLLVRFYEPQAGRIVVNGDTPLQDVRRDEWARKVSCVFQESYFFAGTIRDNVLLGDDRITDERLMELCGLCCVDDVVRRLPDGFDTVIGERGITLSGGERQRLALVRALVRNPDILILDEATSALDYETERRVQAAMDEYRRGKTTIVIAHRLSTIRNADTIFVLQRGRIVESGTDAELLANGSVYRQYVEKQVMPA